MQVSGQFGINLDDKVAQEALEQRLGRCHFQDIMDLALSKYTCRSDDAFDHLVIFNEDMTIQQVFSSEKDDYTIVYSDGSALGSHQQRFYVRVINPDGCETITMWLIEAHSQRLEEDELHNLGISEEQILNQVQTWFEEHQIAHQPLRFNYLILVMSKKT